MSIMTFIPNPSDNLDCFELKSDGQENWLLCATDGKCPGGWKTALSRISNSDFRGCPKLPGSAHFASEKVALKREIAI